MPYANSDEECLDPGQLAGVQRQKLAGMLREVLATNPFYRRKLGPIDPDRVAIGDLPFTTRTELCEDQAAVPPYGTNLTYPQSRYVRLHQTSGSTQALPDGPIAPLRWLDTPQSWAWFKKCWRILYAAAGVTPEERLFFPFSFGPFIGFWAAFETAVDMGCFCLPAGGMTTNARLAHLLDNAATVVCCTPTYALRMIDAAEELGIDLRPTAVKTLIVAGEPGGSIPQTRCRLESAWDTRVLDHSGMTEIGSCGFECLERPGGLHIIETEFIPEVVDPATCEPVAQGEPGELVLTNLGRWGSPLIRYRTGDQVRMIRDRCACGRWFAWLEGGILGRLDDMVIVRGNNVFPATVEGILRGFAEVAEFRVEVDRRTSMNDLRISIEPSTTADATRLAERITAEFRDRLNFKPLVRIVPGGSLPRFDMKAHRWVFLDGKQ